MTPNDDTLTLEITDVSLQKRIRKHNVRRDASVGDLVQESLPELRLPATSSNGEPLTYHVRLEREGRHLHASERIGDAVRADDSVMLLPNVDAGAGGEAR